MWYPVLMTLLVAYFLGNINGAVFMSVMRGKEDIRQKGSGNAGLTNFVRNYGKAQGLAVVAIDAGKTVLACLAGKLMMQTVGMAEIGLLLGVVGVSLGHDFPILLGFRGGKGIVCGGVAAFLMDWRIALPLAALFAVVFLTTGYVSLGSIAIAAGLAISYLIVYWGNWPMLACGVFVGVLAIFMHRSNIVRLLNGTEKRTPVFHKKENL